MHDKSSGSVPPNHADVLTRCRDIHLYSTRFSNAGNFYVNKSRINQQLLSFARFGAKLWNAFRENLHSRPRRFLNLKKMHFY